MTADNIALEASTRFGALASPGATIVIPSDASVWIPLRTLCVFCQLAENSVAAIPAGVTPSGFTQIGSDVTGTASPSGHGCRIRTSYKVLTAADLGSVKTGMNGVFSSRYCAMVMRFSRDIKTVGVVDSGGLFSVGAPGSISPIDWNGIDLTAHLAMAFAHGTGTVVDYDLQFNAIDPGDFSESYYGSAYIQGATRLAAATGIGASVTRTYYAFKPQGEGMSADDARGVVAPTVRKTGDSGDFNYVGGCLLDIY